MPDPLRSFDTLIRGATVIDGTGAPGHRADVAVVGDRVVAVGDLKEARASVEINGAGRTLAPGFIDVHTHDDNALLSLPEMAPKVTQGVTTVVTGNCGISLAPLCLDAPPPPPLNLLGNAGAYRFARFADYVAALEAAPPAVNAALLVGHSTLRVGTMTDLERGAEPAEIDAMGARLRESLDAGAIGFSTGLFYPTGRAADMAEVVDLVKILAEYGGVYTTHMRDEGDRVEDSLEESFETARRAGVPLIISHHKCMGRRNFGRSTATLARIEDARRHQEIGLDVYPYAAGSTVLQPESIAGAERVIVTWSQAHPEHAGRDLAEIAALWGCDALEAADRLQPAGAIYFCMDEADVRRILAYPHAMVGSDGLPHDKHPHPRLWGTFPRVLGHYARDLGLFSLEEAVRRMTGLPAAKFRLADRGRIAPGFFADLVLFDAGAIRDRATYEDPVQPAAGIEMVMVNGRPVLENGSLTTARPGRVLRRVKAA